MNPSLFSLEGKTAVVTGARSGIGKAVAGALARAGCDIAAVGRQPMPELQKEVSEAGLGFLEIRCDLARPGQGLFDAIVEKTVSRFGRVDVLVNNAGLIRRNDALDFTVEDWDQVMDINLKTVFFLSRTVARRFVGQKSGGKIINLASLLSFQGGIRVASYTASKSAVMGLTRALCNEFAKHRINVNAIAPGYVKTEFTLALQQDESRYQEILSRIPAGRWADPDDIAGTAVFLASPASDYVNGFTIAVDGGWLAR